MRRSIARLSPPVVRRTGASNSVTLRIKLPNVAGALAKATQAIGDAGGSLGAIDIVNREEDYMVRDLSVDCWGPEHTHEVEDSVACLEGFEVLAVSDRTLKMHEKGKLNVVSKFPVTNREELSMAYTPGVARVCQEIARKKSRCWDLTIKANTIAVVSDGTAVLGLGDIGPEAAMPVMEGKCQLFKQFANVDAFPICLDTKDPEEIISIVKAIAPAFGGVNLEDISAPRCFEIEQRLKEELSIPVMHDDQHGTAIVLGAAFLNALRVLNRKAEDQKVVVCGVGAAGTACTMMLLQLGVKNIVGCDIDGAVCSQRSNLTPALEQYREMTNPNDESGSVSEVMKGADFFVGVSGPGVISAEDLQRMNPNPVVFAMANPTPEILPELAAPHVAIMATGRSDYPNQINNVLAFPGIFRGALDVQATDINTEMRTAAANAIASSVPESDLCPDYIIPSVFNREVANKVREAVAQAAINSGITRKTLGDSSPILTD